MKSAILRVLPTGDTYFFDIFDAAAVDLFQKAGFELTVVERIGAAGFDLTQVLSGAVEYLDRLKPDIVFVEYAWNPDLGRMIKERVGCKVVVVGSVLAFETGYVDFVLREPDPLSMLELALRLDRKDTDFSGIPALARPDESGFVVDCPEPHTVFEIFDKAQPNYSKFRWLGPGRQLEVRKHIAGDWGCIYRNRGLRIQTDNIKNLPEFVFCSGCTFCSRPTTDRTPTDKKLTILEKQLHAVLSYFPYPDKIILIDEQGLSYIDRLARVVSKLEFVNTKLLVSGRLDQVEKYAGKLEAACRLLYPRVKIALYQFGIENLAQSVLDRYNKGLSVSQIERALQFIKRLEREVPGIEVEQSFGFIMFDPWTTIEELEENVERGRRVEVEYFRGRVALTSLRLYPELFLYWRAREQGLLTGRVVVDSFGYQAGAEWRFADEKVAKVARWLYRNWRDFDSTLDALEAALDSV